VSGGGSTISTSEPRLGAMRVQQSSYGVTLPVVYGRTRVTGNLIWYGDFVAIAHTTTQQSGGKGGGGDVTQESTTYTYEAAVMMALCEGPVGGVVSAWRGKERFDQDPLGKLALSFASGQAGQGAWSHLSTNHPSEAIGYSQTAYVYGANYQLTNNAEIHNHSFELDGKLQYGNGVVDANPADVVNDLLTSVQYGASFPPARMASMASYSAYCRAMSLFISPAFTEQQEAREHLRMLTALSNSACVWSEGQLKLVPYGDEAISGNGATFTPNLTPLYDLTDDDYIVSGGAEDPVRCERKTTADAFNQVQVEYLNRANAYNVEIVEAKDQSNIEQYGLRPQEPVKMHGICDPAVARRVAQLLLQRALYVRNEYEFRLGWKFALLEPMDLVTLTDPGLGLAKTPVRVTSIEEDEDGLLTVRAEDYPFGVASASLYPAQVGAGYAANYNAAPGNVTTPVFFEPPIELTTTGLEVWCAVSGQPGSLWGGCTVWASMDGNTFKQVGTVRGGARYGTLTAGLPAGPGGSLPVALAGQGGQMLSGTALDAQQLNTLCWAGGEFLAYETATLTGANAYTLTGLVRGAYGSPSAVKAAGAPFVRVDQAIAKSEPLALDMVGKPVFFKFTSFNVYGGGEQSLADVSTYAYTITGDMLKLPPSNVSGLSIAVESNGLRVRWTPCPDQDYLATIVKVGPSWDTATEVARKAASSHLLPFAATGALTVWAAHLDVYGNASSAPASVSFTIAAPSPAQQLTLGFGTANIEAAWVAPAVSANQQPLDRVELSWGPAFTTIIDGKRATTSSFGWLPAGTHTLYARYVDAAGNVGTVNQASLQVLAPAQPVMTAVETQINAVTLRWQDAKTSQPIRKYAIYYADAGTPFASAMLYGSAGADSRSDILFFRAAGAKVAYLVSEDVAGNLGAPRQIDVNITMPNDFVLATEYYEDWQPAEVTNGNIIGGANGQIILPAVTGRTWGQRLSNSGWTTAQQKIDAGFPIVVQPVPASGKHVESRDLGKVLATAVIRVMPSIQSSVPGFAATVRIRASVGDSGAWQDWLVGEAATFSNFRHLEVEYGVTSDGKGFVVLDDLYVKVEINEVTESAVLTLSALDAAGSVYVCTKTFQDLRSAIASPLSSPNIARINCIVDDSTLPARVYVQAWDTSNNRTGGTVSLYLSGV
jgi:hypothetical protein